MGITFGATQFGAHHAMGAVSDLPYRVGVDRCQKLGHPEPESYFASEVNSGWSQQMQW